MAATLAPFTASPLFSLEGRVALVTGASQGIGAAVAQLLGTMGADVAVNHLDDTTLATKVVEQLSVMGRRASAFDVDVARRDVVDALVRPVEKQLGDIDVLVINAARTIYRKLESVSEEDIDAQIEMNFKATIRLVNATVEKMARRGFGRIVTIGSINQEAPIPILPVYGALKAAQNNLMRGLARRWSAHGVTFNNVSPGLIRTERNEWRRAPGGDWNALSRTASLIGRAGTPDEVAWIVAMLCAPGGSYVTGENVYVAGGAQIPGPRDLAEPL
jgi:NAD(P)-dependent dehydrogenase (short-subunit alcohol dehydrogenase family)